MPKGQPKDSKKRKLVTHVAAISSRVESLSITELVRAIVLCQALPFMYGVVRPRDNYSAQPSGTVRLRQRGDVTWPNDSVITPIIANQYEPANQLFAVLLRDPRCCLILTDKNPVAGRNAPYIWQAENEDILTIDGNPLIVGDIPTAQAAKNGGDGLSNFLDIKGAAFDPSFPNGFPFHGDFLYAGRSKNIRWMWYDGGLSGGAQVITVSAGTDGLQYNGCNIVVWAWNKGVPYIFVAFGEGANSHVAGEAICSFTAIEGSDYIAIETSFVSSQTDTPQRVYVRVSQVSFGAIRRHIAAPQLNTHEDTVDSLAAVGQSLLFKNVSKVLDLNGQWMAVQPPLGNCWQNILTSPGKAAVNDIFGNMGLYKMNATAGNTKGYYGFLKPNKPIKFEPMFNNTIGATQQQTGWDMDSQNFKWIAMKCSDDGRTFSYEQNQGHAFYSDDQWQDTSDAVVNPDAWEQAAQIISAMPSDMDNPVHWSEIWSYLKRGIRAIGGPLVGAFPETAPFRPLVDAAINSLIPEDTTS